MKHCSSGTAKLETRKRDARMVLRLRAVRSHRCVRDHRQRRLDPRPTRYMQGCSQPKTKERSARQHDDCPSSSVKEVQTAHASHRAPGQHENPAVSMCATVDALLYRFVAEFRSTDRSAPSLSFRCTARSTRSYRPCRRGSSSSCRTPTLRRSMCCSSCFHTWCRRRMPSRM